MKTNEELKQLGEARRAKQADARDAEFIRGVHTKIDDALIARANGEAGAEKELQKLTRRMGQILAKWALTPFGQRAEKELDKAVRHCITGAVGRIVPKLVDDRDILDLLGEETARYVRNHNGGPFYFDRLSTPGWLAQIGDYEKKIADLRDRIKREADAEEAARKAHARCVRVLTAWASDGEEMPSEQDFAKTGDGE